MSLSINYRNTVNIVKVPFPPSISVDEIVQIHLKNGIKNVNETMNAFMIYRKEYNHIVAKFNLSRKDVSKFVSISWRNEPKNVKEYYRQMAKNVKKCFKEKVPTLCFINSNQINSKNDNHAILGTSNPSLNTNQNFPPPVNMDQNLSSPYSTYFNYSPDLSDSFENSLNTYMTMDDDNLMNYLSEDLALTYRAIIKSLPV
ncbi:2787_t:CDS:1 [Diversispora eburnea]|uniref:2787_t:CDS:1 n=1 Tax=Diversispora eburnea TaxID=1213867 RepID=A0A9N8VXX4_9GLOM|nr:2787_t:CDS:1 [Diversispora eburnea]